MRYKGYEAIVDFDEADRVLHGRTLGTRDVISFEADSAHEIERAFHEAVDDYIEQCAETGQEPDRSFSGRLILRMEPALHRDVYLEAAREGTSLNAWIVESLASMVAERRNPEAAAMARQPQTRARSGGTRGAPTP